MGGKLPFLFLSLFLLNFFLLPIRLPLVPNFLPTHPQGLFSLFVHSSLCYSCYSRLFVLPWTLLTMTLFRPV